MAFKPFKDGSTLTLGEFTVESQSDRMVFSGTMEAMRDKASLARLRTLREMLDETISALETQTLPDVAESGAVATRTADNPLR